MNLQENQSRKSALIKLARLPSEKRAELLALEAERRGIHMPDVADDANQVGSSPTPTKETK